MIIKFFDTHAHYNEKPLLDDIDNHFNFLISNGFFVNIVGTDLNNSLIAINLAKKYNNAIATIGIHPCDSNGICESDFQDFEFMLQQNQSFVYAIGECGLDYHYENYDKTQQIYVFKKQIEIALKYNLTLVLHIREAHPDAIDILSKYDFKSINVIIHCYTDNWEHASWYVRKGFYVSIPGVVTFKNANDLRNVAKNIPYDQLLTETDAPFLAPVPMRGKVNCSNYLSYTNEYIANLRNIKLDDFNQKMVKNALSAFNLTIT